MTTLDRATFIFSEGDFRSPLLPNLTLNYLEARRVLSLCPSPADLPVGRGMLEVAEEIVGAPETPGIEEGPLESLVRYAFYAGLVVAAHIGAPHAIGEAR